MIRFLFIAFFGVSVAFAQNSTFEIIYKLKSLEDKVKNLEKQLQRLEYLEYRVLELEKQLKEKKSTTVKPQPVEHIHHTQPKSGVDAICSWNSRNAYYFFKGSKYAKQAQQMGAPRNIANNWNGLWSNLDAAVEFNNKNIYFFKGAHYRAYNMSTYKLGGVNKIAGNWHGVWTDGVDAALRWGNSVYFFRGSQYIAYNLKTYKSGSPKPIAGNWGGIWSNGVDAAVSWSNGYIYFFKGNQYMRYNKKTYKAEGPWALSTWKGLGF